MESENLSSLIRLSVSDGQKTDSSKDVSFIGTVKPVLSGHSKIDKTKILMTNGSLMKL